MLGDEGLGQEQIQGVCGDGSPWVAGTHCLCSKAFKGRYLGRQKQGAHWLDRGKGAILSVQGRGF